MKQNKELKALSKQDSEKKLSELRQELMQARAQIATGTVPKNPGRVRAIRKTIARILTFSNQKEEAKKVKNKIACGGTAKNGIIELQGKHVDKMKEELVKLGFSADQIIVKEQ